MSALFSFGTLRDPELFHRVVGRPMAAFTIAPAVLRGHGSRRAEGFSYPVLVVEEGGTLEGIVVHGLTPVEIERVQYYETLEYELRAVAVEVSGAPVLALGFFATERLEPSTESWQLALWQETAKPRNLIEAELAMRLFGRVPLSEINDHWPAIVARAEAILAGEDAAAFDLAGATPLRRIA